MVDRVTRTTCRDILGITKKVWALGESKSMHERFREKLLWKKGRYRFQKNQWQIVSTSLASEVLFPNFFLKLKIKLKSQPYKMKRRVSDELCVLFEKKMRRYSEEDS